MWKSAGDPTMELSLPPGFRFHPTDEELVVHYLRRKVAGQPFSLDIIGDIDLYKFDPWFLPGKALFGEKEWYFFSPRDRKYPNGSRPNRVAGSGYWKATGTDKNITVDGRKVGIKKALVFYTGKAPKGVKTNWIMHEYRLAEKINNTANRKPNSRLDDWVLCRIYKKGSGGQKNIPAKQPTEDASCFDELLASLPEINDQFFTLPRIPSLKLLPDEKLNLQNIGAEKMICCSWKEQQQQTQYSNCATDTDLGAVTETGSTGKFSPVFDNMNFLEIPPLYQIDSTPEKGRSSMEEEVESTFRLERFDDPIFGQSFSHLLNPYVFSNPNLP